MIVGVLSDTHGRIDRAKGAATLFQRLGAQAIVHCGDVGQLDVLEALIGPPLSFVWGNTDFADPAVRHLEGMRVRLPGELPLRFELDGCRFAVCHGHEAEFAQLLDLHQQRDAQTPDDHLILHGHTHRARIDTLPSGARIVNPGALQRAAFYSVAIIDTRTRDVVHYRLPDDAERDPLEVLTLS